MIDRFSKVKTAKMKPVIREILRMSVYQILYMERVPDSAVCNEAVKLAKKRKFQGLSGFVNGVLRTVSREKENLSWKDGIHPVFDPAVDAVHVGGDVWKRDRGDDRRHRSWRNVRSRCGLTRVLPLRRRPSKN